MPVTPSSPAGRVAGKIALVTGAGSGIGRATALALAAEGALVACADLNLAGAEATVNAIAAAGKTGSAHRLDATTTGDWREVIEGILKTHGRLDIAVNCAGI